MKRFEIESNGIWEWWKKKLTWQELCDVLNELYTENEELKSKNEKLEHAVLFWRILAQKG